MNMGWALGPSSLSLFPFLSLALSLILCVFLLCSLGGPTLKGPGVATKRLPSELEFRPHTRPPSPGSGAGVRALARTELAA